MLCIPAWIGARAPWLPDEVSLHVWNAKILADLPRQVVIDLIVSWYCRALIQGRIVPPRMSLPFSEQCATAHAEMP